MAMLKAHREHKLIDVRAAEYLGSEVYASPNMVIRPWRYAAIRIPIPYISGLPSTGLHPNRNRSCRAAITRGMLKDSEIVRHIPPIVAARHRQMRRVKRFLVEKILIKCWRKKLCQASLRGKIVRRILILMPNTAEVILARRLWPYGCRK